MNPLRFITARNAQIELAPWGKHWWLSRPGFTDTKQLTLVRVTMRPGTGHRFHYHPAREEIIYVIEGLLEYEIAGKTWKVKAGDVLFVPAGASHTAKNIGTSNGAELATYIVEKGKPLLTIVK